MTCSFQYLSVSRDDPTPDCILYVMIQVSSMCSSHPCTWCSTSYYDLYYKNRV